jgi:surface protein
MEEFKEELSDLLVEKHLFIFMYELCDLAPMIIDIDITNNETNNYIKMPINFSGDVIIDYGDETVNINNIEHTYKEAKMYQIKIYGEIDAFDCNAYYDNPKLRINQKGLGYITKILQYGESKMKKLNFYGCSNLVDIPDKLPITVTDISWLFFSCQNFNKDLSKFITTQVTDMSFAFAYSSFNNSLASFDTSNVKYFDCMFLKAFKFNQSLEHFSFENCYSSTNFITDAIQIEKQNSESCNF